MKVKVNLSNQTLEYMDSQPYIQGTDTRNKLSVYIEHSTVPQTEGAFNIMIAYALQNGRTTIKMANTGATSETIDDVLYDIFYFTAPKVLTSISGNFVATLILKVNSNTYKVNVLNTVLNAVDFEAFEDALDDTASEVLESLESMAGNITYLQSQVVGVLHNTDIVDNDDSNDPTKVLSARMGKVLAERIGATTSGLVSATYNESTGVLTLTYENDDTYEMKIGLSTSDKSNMADDVENTILADLFETFSTVKSYSVGDFVNYENNIYEFVSDKSSGAWDSTKVVIANLNDYIDEVNTKLDAQDNLIATMSQPKYYSTSSLPTTDVGLVVGSDGYIYTWNGTQYVTTGILYQATQIADGDAFKPFTVSIPNTADLNDYTTIGSYWVLSGSQTNKPSGYTSNGMLLVFTAKNYSVDTLFQILIDDTGIHYIRRKYSTSWTDWVKLTDYFKGYSETVTSDFNNYVTQGSYWISSSSVTNKPSLTNGMLIVFTTQNSGIDIVFQYAIDDDGKVFVRRKYSTSWTDWVNVAKTYFTGGQNIITDFNNYTDEGSYWFANSNTSTISNRPFNDNGMLLVFKANPTSTNVLFQIAFNQEGNLYTRRCYSGVWTSWFNMLGNASQYQKTNISGKKWYACGDSFTANGYASPVPSEAYLQNGKYQGEYAVYPYYIGNRTDCDIHNVAVGGMTLATYTGGTNCFTYNNQYQTLIGADADIITLYFGINDGHQNVPIGTINDNTTDTFYGALNVVISWILENRPNAKLGVIISNGCDTTEYPTATINACKKWGIPYLDINGDETLPMVIRTNMRTNLSEDAYDYWLEKYRVSATNLHPNYKAHEDESYMIQQFLERL